MPKQISAAAGAVRSGRALRAPQNAASPLRAPKGYAPHPPAQAWNSPRAGGAAAAAGAVAAAARAGAAPGADGPTPEQLAMVGAGPDWREAQRMQREHAAREQIQRAFLEARLAEMREPPVPRPMGFELQSKPQPPMMRWGASGPARLGPPPLPGPQGQGRLLAYHKPGSRSAREWDGGTRLAPAERARTHGAPSRPRMRMLPREPAGRRGPIKLAYARSMYRTMGDAHDWSQ